MDDIRPKGTVEVECAVEGCGWRWWLHHSDPLVPDGPFRCAVHASNQEIAAYDAAIRAAGGDPREVAKRGLAYVQALNALTDDERAAVAVILEADGKGAETLTIRWRLIGALAGMLRRTMPSGGKP